MARKSKKPMPIHRPLSEFYTEEQKQQLIKEKKRKQHQDIEMEIFEHLKEHTKKVLEKK